MGSDFSDDLLQDYSDAELVRHILTSPRTAPICGLFQLSPILLTKHYYPSLVEDMLKATDLAHQLGIRVPCIKRMVVLDADAYCIMERMKGSTLEETWKQVGWFKSAKLALQLRRYVKLLRSFTSSTAGSIATGECRSFWLEDTFGLPTRSTPEHISSFIQFWVNFTSMGKEVANHSLVQPTVQISPLDQVFVLTHHDLAPRNIILDPFWPALVTRLG